jgi:YjbE family integral membrane protein
MAWGLWEIFAAETALDRGGGRLARRRACAGLALAAERRHCRRAGVAGLVGARGIAMTDFSVDSWSVSSVVLASLQILFVNLLLSADNALAIAMASRGLSDVDAQRATLLGIVGAIVLRLAMGSVAVAMLRAPFLQLVAGIVLLVIAVRLTLVRDDENTQIDPATALRSGGQRRVNLFGAIWSIIAADAAMSLDNVIAVAAIARGSIAYIAFGLVASIPMLVWGSMLMRRLLDRHGFLVVLSGMALGWIAGGIAISDPTIAPVIAAKAPALPIAAPPACAIFVFWQSAILGRRRRRP